MPVVSDDRPMKMGERSMMRVRSTVRSICFGSWNGATKVGTTYGAAIHITIEKPTRRISTAFMTLEATCHASASRSRAR